MSYIIAPDPFPGRCLNCRPVRDWNNAGQPASVRCLDYDGHDGKCRFPEPPGRVQAQGIVNSTYQQRAPEPWISPVEPR